MIVSNVGAAILPTDAPKSAKISSLLFADGRLPPLADVGDGADIPFGGEIDDEVVDGSADQWPPAMAGGDDG